MVNAKINRTTRSVTVSGDAGGVMLFYCAWQSQLWPGWTSYAIAHQDASTEQFKKAVSDARNGKELILSYDSREFRDAFDDAVKACEYLDVAVAIVYG